MTLDATARSTADRLIKSFGKTVTLRRTASTYDPTTGKTTETTQDFSVKVSPPENFRESLIDGTLVKAGDLTAQLAALNAPVVPNTIQDKVVIDGVAWSLVRVDPLFSGEQAALYRLHLRA